MAPYKNGQKQLTEEERAAAEANRSRFQDEVSKKMGELLLKGQTMLDEYCDQCNGILMEDRQGVRTCVTCQVYRQYSTRSEPELRDIDEIETDIEITSIPLQQTAPPQTTSKLNAESAHSFSAQAASLQTTSSTNAQPAQINRPHINLFNNTTSTEGVDGVDVSTRAIRDKIIWTSKSMTETRDLAYSMHLVDLIGNLGTVMQHKPDTRVIVTTALLEKLTWASNELTHQQDVATASTITTLIGKLRYTLTLLKY